MRNNARVMIIVLLATVMSAAASVADEQPARGFSFVTAKDALDVHLDGRRIASYVFRHQTTLRPFFAHVKTPSGIQVTRNFPPVPGRDPVDHATMHPGIWLAFARLNNVTFWHNTHGRVVHQGFVNKPKAGKSASFTVKNEYVTPDKTVICREQTAYRFTKDPAGYLITIDARLTAVKPLTLGVIEEMGLGARVASAIRVKEGNGTIVNSAGARNEKGTWGKVDKWWDYHGRIDERAVGILLMSAPSNPPVWSHSRDYGLLVMNPMPVDRPENRKKTRLIEPGKDFRLRFGVLIHEGDKLERAAAYERFVKALQSADGKR